MKPEAWKLLKPKLQEYLYNRLNERNKRTINLYLKFEHFQIKFFLQNIDLRFIKYLL